ncbi:aminoglycoside phosphotransferase family protein [Lewinella sp. LCG006]|uniref:aminoglycoside phosphotransferase family protein n=1 Tax=Lewinella sp. LCG006 TaxID=3231911 RepID=UPI00345FCF3C
METPASEVVIDETLVRTLLEKQHPDLAHLELRYLTEGWDNKVYHLGEDYLVRLPRRQQALAYLLREQEWLPILAPTLPIPTPAPLRLGKEQDGYPWPWSITPWFPGQAAAEALPYGTEAPRLAQFLKALHRPAPDNAPFNPHRGYPLHHKADLTEARLQRFLAAGLLSENILSVWSAALSAPAHQGPKCLLHGDLHPKNIIVHQGKFSAIIDWGDMTAGDPATDLASFWMLFGDPKARREGLAVYAPNPALLARARGWAVFFGAILLDIGLGGDPVFEQVGRFTLQNLADDENLQAAIYS